MMSVHHLHPLINRIQRPVALLAAAWVFATPGFLTAQSPDLYIRTTPPGASVEIDGETVGMSPVTVPSVAPGVHLAVATLAGYQPLYHTFTVEPDPRIILDLVLEPLTGLVLVHSTPSGADVEINDIHRGTTPLLVTDLPIGAYRVNFSRSGSLPRQVELVVEGRQPIRLHTELVADTATLTLNGRPSGASVTIDGAHRGDLPCTVAGVRTGDIRLAVESPGYRPFSETLTLRAGDHREMDIVLQPEPSTLTVTSDPAGARIFVNTSFRGQAPVTLSGLAAGEYVVRAELKAHDTETRSVRLAAGQTRVMDMRLDANAGRLDITTEPAGVMVLLDGVRVGTTAPEPNQTDNLSARFVMPLVPVGPHTLTLTKAGYHSLDQALTITRNETHAGHYTLTRRFIPNTLVQTLAGETYRGVLAERNADSIKLELRPGIFKTIRQAEIRRVTPLRKPDPSEIAPETPQR